MELVAVSLIGCSVPTSGLKLYSEMADPDLVWADLEMDPGLVVVLAEGLVV